MKKYTVLLLLLCFFSVETNGQKRKRFELDKKEVRELEKRVVENDVSAYLSLAFHYKNKGFNNGETHIFQENLKKAEKYLEKAIHYSKSSYRASFQKQRYPKKKTVDRRTLKKRYSRALHDLGGLYAQLKKYTLAKKYFDESSELNYTGAHSSLGNMYARGTGVSINYDKAIYYYKRAYEGAKDRTKIRTATKIGQVYLNKLKDSKTAITWFEKALNLGGKNSRLLQYLEKAKSLNNEEINAINTNPIIQSKIQDYQRIKSKTEKSLETLEKALIPLQKIKDNYFNLLNERKEIITRVKKENASLNKRKSEFETQKEYDNRKSKYKALVKNSTNEIDAKIQEVLKPYQSQARKNYTAEKALKNEYYSHVRKINEQKKVLRKINKGAPETILYKNNSIVSMNYMAEDEKFKIVMDVSFLAPNSSRKLQKFYYIKVPRDNAQGFKNNTRDFKYFYYLEDLQAIITQDKTYVIEPIHTWYTRIACDIDEEKAVLLLNGLPSDENLENHIRSVLKKNKDFVAMNNKTTPEYGKGFSEEYKKLRVEVSFSEKGKLVGCDVTYPFQHSQYGLLYNTYTNKAALKELGNLIASIIRNSDIKVIPKKRKCEPVRSGVLFYHKQGKK